MKSLVLLSTLLLSYCSTVSALSFPDPYVTITSASLGECFFKMIPMNDVKFLNDSEDTESFGIAYQFDENGNPQEVWRTQGWYAFETYLSNGNQCEYVVRIGQYPSWFAPIEQDHLAVAFYKKGKFLKKYAVADLINDHNKGINVDKDRLYTWRKNSYISGYNFYIETTENNLFTFDMSTGDVVSVTQQRYEHPTQIRQNLDIFIPAALYGTSEIYTELEYQGINKSNQHHWRSNDYKTADDLAQFCDVLFECDPFRPPNSIKELGKFNGNHLFDIDLKTGKTRVLDSEMLREQLYSTKIDKNFNIMIRSAEYGRSQEVSALLRFQGIDAINQYHWVLDRYEITELWSVKVRK